MQLSTTEHEQLYAILQQYDENPQVQRMREFIQHGDVTTYQHCKNVVRVSFWLNRRLHLHADEKMCIRDRFQGLADLPRFLPDLGQVFFDGGVLFQIFPDEHQRKADQQKAAAEPDGPAAQQRSAPAADAGPDGKQQDDAKVPQHPVHGPRFVGPAPDAQRLHAAAQVTDAHGAGKGVAVQMCIRDR